MSAAKQFTRHDYTVGWLCALPTSELVAAKLMLDHRHPKLNLDHFDQNIYTYGSINGHNVVITCLPPGQTGPVSAQKLVQPLRQSFPNLRIHLFVGIGGGVPRPSSSNNPTDDIYLGDVAIGWSDETGAPAVVQWDYRRYYSQREYKSLGILDKPGRQLVSAVGEMLSERLMSENPFHAQLEKLEGRDQFQYPGSHKDKLYQTSEPTQLLQRKERSKQDPVFHLGTILSGSSVMQNAEERDQLSKAFHNAICFEMEAAGVMDETHCLVIRGISDYADGHKTYDWQNYAAGTAAAFAGQLLFIIQPANIADMRPVAFSNCTS